MKEVALKTVMGSEYGQSMVASGLATRREVEELTDFLTTLMD